MGLTDFRVHGKFWGDTQDLIGQVMFDWRRKAWASFLLAGTSLLIAGFKRQQVRRSRDRDHTLSSLTQTHTRTHHSHTHTLCSDYDWHVRKGEVLPAYCPHFPINNIPQYSLIFPDNPQHSPIFPIISLYSPIFLRSTTPWSTLWPPSLNGSL